MKTLAIVVGRRNEILNRKGDKAMKILAIMVLVLGVAFFGIQSEVSANLLASADFDSGYPGTGWDPLSYNSTPWYGGCSTNITDYSVGGGVSISKPAGGGYSGLYSAEMFMYGTAGAADWDAAWLGQRVAVSANTAYSGSVVAKKLGDISGSQAAVKVIWLNGNTQIGDAIVSDAKLTNDDSGWKLLQTATLVSPGTANAAKFEVVYNRASCLIAPSDIVIDDASFDAVPEPASLLLLGSGLVGLFGVSRRKK